MKKFTKTLVAAILIVASIAAFMIGCKKEESSQMKDGASQTEQNMSPIEKEVLDFLYNYSEMKRGAKIDGEAISTEDACRLLETAFNYNFGFTQTFLVNMQINTVCVAMPKTNPEGNIAYGDMMNTYSDIVDAVREVYRGIDLENKTLQFVMMNHDDDLSKDNVDSIRIVLNTGSRTTNPEIPDPQPYPWYGIPFNEPECYLWSFTNIYGNNNNGGFINTNYADVQLQMKIANYDSRKAIATEQNPTFIVDPYRYETFQGGQDLDEWLFYVCGLTEEEVNSYFLCWNYLNQEYSDIMLNTHSISMEIRPYEHDGYYRTRVYGKIQCIDLNATPKLYCISHVVEIDHATICKRVNTEYPIPID